VARFTSASVQSGLHIWIEIPFMPSLLRYIFRRLLSVPVTLLVITSILYGFAILVPVEDRAQLYWPSHDLHRDVNTTVHFGLDNDLSVLIPSALCCSRATSAAW
jgi:hypothetical protein